MTHFPPKNILVAFDMSDVSRTASRHAAALADRFGAALHAIYVEPWLMGMEMVPPPILTPDRIRVLRKKMIAVIGDEAKVTVVQGGAPDRILDYARRHRIDLIVVGTHGRTGLKRVLLGSTAEEVIRASPVPVLAARGPVRRVRRVLAPVNFTSYAEYGLAWAAGAAAALKADLTALHVADDPVWSGNIRFRLDGMFRRLPPEILKKCRITPETAAGEAAAGIMKARKGHEWIVLVAHEKSRIKSAFFGTTLERVLRRSATPVLCLPFPRREASARIMGGRSLTAR